MNKCYEYQDKISNRFETNYNLDGNGNNYESEAARTNIKRTIKETRVAAIAFKK
jgi:hypothetical protein